jgi:endonuclease YncB( thermonuclease family)
MILSIHRRRRGNRRGPSVRNIGTALFVVALAASAGYAILPDASGPRAPGRSDGITGIVTRVVDGDTFWLGSRDERIRVWGSTRLKSTCQEVRGRPPRSPASSAAGDFTAASATSTDTAASSASARYLTVVISPPR